MNNSNQRRRINAHKLFALGVVFFGILAGCSFPGRRNTSYDLGASPEPIASYVPYVYNPDRDAADDCIADYTVMLYVLGSNLETNHGMATENLESMGRISDSSDLHIIIETGGAEEWHNSVMKNGKTGRYVYKNGNFETIEQLGKVSMVEQETVTDFLDFVAQNYPAEHYVLLMWDHGGGIPVGFGYDENFPHETLTADEIGNAIARSAIHPDIVMFDACYMSTLEVARALSGVADYMIASEETLYAKYTFADDVTKLIHENPTIAPLDLATGTIDRYVEEVLEDDPDDTIPTNLAVVDLAKMGTLEESMDTFFLAAKENIENGELMDYLVARSKCGGFPSIDCVDAVSLLERYDTAEAQSLCDAIEEAVVYSRGNISFAHGLSMYAPGMDLMAHYLTGGRDSFFDLDSEEEVAFFDAMYSAALNYSRGDTSRYRSEEWYDADVAAVYNDYANMYPRVFAESNEPYTVGSDSYRISSYYYGDHTLRLTENDWKVIDTVETQAYYKLKFPDETLYVELGSDDVYDLEEDGYSLNLSFPKKWLCMDGQVVEFVKQDDYMEEDGNWSASGAVLAALNGDFSTLIHIDLYFDSDSDMPVILGYHRLDPKTLEYKDGDSYLYPLLPGDRFTFAYRVIDVNEKTGETTDTIYSFGEEHVVTEDGFKVYYGSIDSFKGMLKDSAQGILEEGFSIEGLSLLHITDYYGNNFMTEVNLE